MLSIHMHAACFFIVAALALGLYHEGEVFKVNRYAARYPSYCCMYQQQVAQGIKKPQFPAVSNHATFCRMSCALRQISLVPSLNPSSRFSSV